MRCSALSILRHCRTGKRWRRVWRDPEPRRAYEVLIVGAGGHDLATACYLAKNHGMRRIAVLERRCIGGGNAGRNTTIVRSNSIKPGDRALYEHSLRLSENLSHELNCNVMFSQRAHKTDSFGPSQTGALARAATTSWA